MMQNLSIPTACHKARLCWVPGQPMHKIHMGRVNQPNRIDEYSINYYLKLRWGKAWLYGLGGIYTTYLDLTYTFFLLLSDCIHTVASSDTLARRPELRAKVKDTTIMT